MTLHDPQRRAADPNLSAFVTANAGSGKTKTLIDRVARLLLEGAPPAAILGEQDTFGRILIPDELTSENMGAQRFCREKLKPLLNRKYRGMAIHLEVDPACNQRAQTDEKSVAQILEKELGVRPKGADSNTLVDRLGAVDTVLNRLVEGKPGYLIDPSCKVLIRGFTSGYRYPMSNKGVKGDSPEKNAYSHPHDANQYLCMAFERDAAREARRRNLPPIRQYRNPYVY